MCNAGVPDDERGERGEGGIGKKSTKQFRSFCVRFRAARSSSDSLVTFKARAPPPRLNSRKITSRIHAREGGGGGEGRCTKL